MAPEQSSTEFVPLVVLQRGDQVLRKEYPEGKFSIGSSDKANLQFSGAGVPDLHPLLAPGKKGLFVYFREEMAGRVSKNGKSSDIAALIALGTLPEKNGLYALNLVKGTELELDFGEYRLRIGFGPKPQARPAPVAAPRIPVRQAKPRLMMRATFQFTTIPTLDEDPKTFWVFWGSLIGVAILYAASLFALKFMTRFVPERDVMAAPPPRVVKLVVPEKEPEPVVEEVKQEEAPAEEEPSEEAEKEESKPEPAQEEVRRAEAKQKVQKLGLIQMLSSQGGSVTSDIQGVMDSLSNVFAAGALTTNPDEGEQTLQGIEAFGEGSGGVDGSIAGLKRVGRRKVGAEAEKVDNPVVEGEAAGDQRRSMAVISATMRRYAPGLKIVYKRLLRAHPTAAGKITFSFVIKADGSVTDVKVLNSAFKAYPDFERDLADRISKIKFEPIPKGDITVQFPFIFTEQG